MKTNISGKNSSRKQETDLTYISLWRDGRVEHSALFISGDGRMQRENLKSANRSTSVRKSNGRFVGGGITPQDCFPRSMLHCELLPTLVLPTDTRGQDRGGTELFNINATYLILFVCCFMS